VDLIRKVTAARASRFAVEVRSYAPVLYDMNKILVAEKIQYGGGGCDNLFI
jgi:hypothetical protein